MDELIKRGTVVRVDKEASLPSDQLHLRDRLGKVVEDSLPGTAVLLDFYENKIEQIHSDVLSVILDRDDPKWNIRASTARVYWSNPESRRKPGNVRRLDAMKRRLATGWRPSRWKYSAEVVTKTREFVLQNPTMKLAEIAKVTGTDEGWVNGIRQRLRQEGLLAKYVVNDATKAKIEAILREQAEHRTIKGDLTAILARQFNVKEGTVTGIQKRAGICFQQPGSAYLSFAKAREWAQASGIKSSDDWQYARLPKDISRYPHTIYKDEWTGWRDFLGNDPWVQKGRTIEYLKNLQKLLPHLSDADVLTLLRQARLLNRLGNLRLSGGAAGILKSLRGGELPDLRDDKVRVSDDKDLDEIVDSDYVSPESAADPHLPDRLQKLRATTNTIQYVKESQLCTLRAKWFRDGIAPKLSGDGGELFQEIKQEFEAEVAAVEALPTPWWHLQKGGVLLPPSPMQKYVAWRLKQDRVLGNWSGTGAGKTDSAGLASYVVDSELTVVLAVNSTLLGWKKQLEETFPDSKVFLRWDDVQRGQGCFLVLNYEKFQMGSEMVQKIIALQPEMVVLDEIQSIKQRKDGHSNRSVTVRDMLNELPHAYVLGMTATPVVNELREGISLLEAIKRTRLPLKTRATVTYALDLYAALRKAGVRYIPRYDQTEEKVILTERCDDLRASLSQASDILPIEQVLVGAKLEKVKDRIQPGTVLYMEYTAGLVEQTRSFVQSLGYSVGEYIGETDNEEREAIKQKFIAGEIDVLIGSRAISVGVDGLQHRAKRLILLSLPWTHAAYQQIVGRVYRQGGTGNVEVVIPQIVVGDWSWDKMRYQRIEYKRTLGDCVTDGVVPTSALHEGRIELFNRAMKALNKLSDGATA